MSYSTKFKLKGEVDSEFRPLYTDGVTLKRKAVALKNVLIAVCMRAQDMLPLQKDAGICKSIDFERIYDNISKAVWLYVTYLKDDWKMWLKNALEAEDEYTAKNEVEFYGWKYSNGSDLCRWEDDNDLCSYFTEQLFIKSIEQVPPRYDKDDTMYLNKLEDISATVNDIEECVTSLMDGMFIKRYRGAEDAEEDDEN